MKNSAEAMSELSEELRRRFAMIKLLCLDVDGTLTSGSLIIGGEETVGRSFNTADGLGIRLLIQEGIDVALITAADSESVDIRARQLGITHVYQRAYEKLPIFLNLARQLDLRPEQAAFMGDDLPDMAPMQQAGLALAPPTAVAPVLSVAHYVTQAQAGFGAVREVCDHLLDIASPDWVERYFG